MKVLKSQPAALFSLWLMLVIVSLFSRSYLPIDETRYVTVAWNMWLRDDYLVPWLNGVAYSHKPPMLFWLMNAGWAIFGVNDWWPRLVPSFFALGSVYLTIRLARMLWPHEAQIAAIAPTVLLGSALWTVFTTATMFDMLIAFFSLLGLLGVFTAWRGQLLKGWALVGLAIGGGLLAKGPAILLQILPVAVLAPWWGRGEARAVPFSWNRWYAGLLGAIIFGITIALIWAIPAGMRGGEEYRNAIFWGQTAERMVNAFAHKRPLWWYLPLLPIMLFPWTLWPPVWRGLSRLRHAMDDMGVRFCLTWLNAAFLAFSFISGKQAHYLLPIFPAVALLVARGLPQARMNRYDQLPAALSAFAIGVILMYLPHYSQTHQFAPWISGIPSWTGMVMIVAGAALILIRFSPLLANVWAMTLFSAFAIVVTVYVAVIHSAGLAYDIRPVGARLKALQDAGVPLAHVGQYPGLYQFIGRMKDEPEVVKKSRLDDWFKQHPDGKAIVYFSSRHLPASLKPDYQQPYLGETVVILGRESWPVPKPHVP